MFTKKNLILGLTVLLLGAAAFGFYYWHNKENGLGTANVSTNDTQTSGDANTPEGFNKQKYSINDPSSIWAVVNKGRQLPADYVPNDLVNPSIKLKGGTSDPNMTIRREAADALKRMNDVANSDLGSGFALTSGYRSYQTQASLYDSYLKASGKNYADATSAHAGHSEHQTGFAADVEPVSGKCSLDKCFADTPEGKWLASNGDKYGFVIRYQKDTTTQTGYDFEPWHIRYVGIDLATQLQKNSTTLEQFFGLPYFIDYSHNPFKLSVGS